MSGLNFEEEPLDGSEGDSPVIQVCWLDWDAIQNALRAEVEDLLPNVEFEELEQDTDLNVMTALTTLPVQLVVDSSSLLSTLAIGSSADQNSFAGLRVALWVAWLGLALAAVATATLLFGVIRLSERRATFVSAVTHELRTPLTTFRMYAEMLAPTTGSDTSDSDDMFFHGLSLGLEIFR